LAFETGQLLGTFLLSGSGRIQDWRPLERLTRIWPLHVDDVDRSGPKEWVTG